MLMRRCRGARVVWAAGKGSPRCSAHKSHCLFASGVISEVLYYCASSFRPSFRHEFRTECKDLTMPVLYH